MMEDQEEHPLHKFVTRVDNMPHIHEKVLDHLDMYDMANCLKACKDLRKFIISGIKYSTWVQDELDDEVSKLAMTTSLTGPLKMKEYPKLQAEGKITILQENRFGFSIDNSFWLQFQGSFKGEKVLKIYDMPSGAFTSAIPVNIKYRHRPNVKLLSEARVLLEDQDRVRIAAKSGDEAYKIVYESPPQNLGSRCVQYICEKDRYFFADDGIYLYNCPQACVRLGEFPRPWQFTIYNHLDGSPLRDSAIRIPTKPDNILQRVLVTIIS